MSYVFQNQAVGKATITDETDTKINLAGINTSIADANVIMGGLSTFVDIVGWTITDASRIVTQDIVGAE